MHVAEPVHDPVEVHVSSGALANRHVIVTGASSGIGRALAVRAIRSGAQVLLTARREDRLADAIAEAGGGIAVHADLADPSDCERTADEARRHFGSVDLVVYAAGVAP